MFDIDQQKYKISKACRLLYIKGYVAGVQGNVSARIQGGNIIITRTGYSLRDISEHDIVVCGIEETPSKEPVPSSELPFHKAIYNTRQDVNAIVHTHPYEVLVWFNIDRTQLLNEVFDEFKPRKTQVVKNLPFGSKQLADSIARAAKDSNIIILEDHGLVTFGTSLVEAINLTEQVISKAHYRCMSAMLSHPYREVEKP